MHFKRDIKASVLPTVMVVSALMLLIVFGLLGYSEMGNLITERAIFDKNCRADIESAFVLCENHPDTDGEIQLYDSIGVSTITISHKVWGLYEAVSVAHIAGGMERTNLIGTRVKSHSPTLVYVGDSNPLTITGNTNLTGDIRVPSGRIVYGQSGSTFFSGERVEESRIKASDRELPVPVSDASGRVERLFTRDYSAAEQLRSGDSLRVGFYDTEPMLTRYNGTLRGELYGNIIVHSGDELEIDPSAILYDIVIVGRKVTVGENFRGRLQLFASDTVIVEKGAVLEYPSGIYASQYAELQEGSIVNGYVIVAPKENKNITKPNYKQSRLAKVRGLLYAKGNSHLQGIVSGTAYIEKAVYYSPSGYWKDMLMDFTILENYGMALPLWLTGDTKRKRMIWLD